MCPHYSFFITCYNTLNAKSVCSNTSFKSNRKLKVCQFKFHILSGKLEIKAISLAPRTPCNTMHITKTPCLLQKTIYCRSSKSLQSLSTYRRKRENSIHSKSGKVKNYSVQKYLQWAITNQSHHAHLWRTLWLCRLILCMSLTLVALSAASLAALCHIKNIPILHWQTFYQHLIYL